MLKLSIFVFLGSGLGGVCRFLASAYIGRIAGGAGMFPYEIGRASCRERV